MKANLEIQVSMTDYEAEALLNWLAAENYLLYYKKFN